MGITLLFFFNNSRKIFLTLCFVKLFNLCLAQGQWVWMHGDSIADQPANHGVLGVPSPANKPGARYEAAEWTDQSGNLWLFGGMSSSSPWNDLWKYNVTTNEWTWMHGDNNAAQPGIYGVQGVPSFTNKPGSRGLASCSWVDNAGNLWLFGSYGLDASGTIGRLDDLWMYSIASNEWTWMKGSNAMGQAAAYGTQGVADPTNTPGRRNETSCTWVDNSGNLWLFGGSIGISYLNDLWKYDISTNQWTWVSGDNVPGQSGIYGTQGISSPLNKPGARIVFTSWKDNNGDLWLFGGQGDIASGGGELNDLWKYSIILNEWTWVSGSNTTDQPGVYGSLCTPSLSNVPGARMETRARWTDECGNFYIFGGIGHASSGSIGSLNDLWQYNITANEWTWMSGDNVTNQPGVYGTMGTPNPANKPGARNGTIAWKNNNGLWLFGGSFSGYYNDLWRYIPDKPVADFNFIASACTTLGFTNTSTASCNKISSYEWDFGDPPSGANNTSSLENPSHLYSSIGIYSVTLIVTDCMGMKDTMIQVINLLPPSVFLGNDTSICPGNSLTLDAGNPGSTYLWSTGDTTQTINLTSAATYWVEVNNGICNNRDTISVSFAPTPTVSLGNDTILCSNESLLLDAGNPGSTYLWSTNEITQTIMVSDSNLYSVEVFMGNCSETDTILVSRLSQINLGPNLSLCDVFPDKLILNAGYDPQATYLWSNGESTSSIEVSQAGMYWVEKIAGPCLLTDTIKVTGNLGSSGLYVPNTFTPNTDGLNEIFTGYGEEISYFQMRIFNRWGELIYQTLDLNKGWNGKYKEEWVATGVYLWTVDYKSGCTEDKILHKIGYVLVDK